ncbi:hypothetical protein BHU72_10810 [Desulfuribacillus stibiiarsenatis]|uniref:DUF1540 domain-containing protein n=1 Tax=Desulfuribacillus stibiiarsenatis TaxID=1390249 RepID=A0A1E5L2F9_9FIRM|nr:DUF1540 domain-containing protein [Desulfuribacillus stibiiarsenatis]OEH84296.1 hypothetical protein BHU72_10810 [Desulfuribacillus stibiiarsenatis]
MPDVHCTVDNCKYWTTKNLCTADNIIVQNDGEGGVSPDAQLSSLDATPASSKDETCCQTFQQG